MKPGRRVSYAAAAVSAAAIVSVWMSCDSSSLVQPLPHGPSVDLAVSKSASNLAPARNEQIDFTVIVSNLGPGNATRVVAGDTLPAGMHYVSHSTSAGTYSQAGLWDIGELPVNAQATLTLRAEVESTAPATLVNRAGAQSTAQRDSVPANNVASVTLNVAGTPPGNVVFSSDWSTSTGTTDQALLDGGRWDDVYCSSRAQTLTVLPGSQFGWTRTPNVLRLRQLGPSVCGTLEKRNAVPLTTTNWGRLYFRNDEVGTRHNHVVTYNPGIGSPIQLSMWNRYGTSQGVSIFIRPYFAASGSAPTYPFELWSIGRRGTPGIARLAHGTWYRYEWMMEYVTPRTYRLYPRVYNMAGNLLYDANSFFQNDYNGSTPSLQQWYDAGNVFGLSDPALARNLGLGNEGPAASSSTGGYWYHAAVALSTEGWIGP